MSGRRVLGGDAEQLFHAGLVPTQQSRNRCPKTEAAERQEQVLHEGIHRPAADDTQPVELAVRHGHGVKVHADDDDHRDFGKMIRQVVSLLHRGRVHRGGEMSRPMRVATLAEPLAERGDGGLVKLGQLPSLPGVFHDHQPNPLAIPALRGEPRQLDGPVQQIARHRIRGEAAACPSGAKDFLELHPHVRVLRDAGPGRPRADRAAPV